MMHTFDTSKLFYRICNSLSFFNLYNENSQKFPYIIKVDTFGNSTKFNLRLGEHTKVSKNVHLACTVSSKVRLMHSFVHLLTAVRFKWFIYVAVANFANCFLCFKKFLQWFYTPTVPFRRAIYYLLYIYSCVQKVENNKQMASSGIKIIIGLRQFLHAICTVLWIEFCTWK